MSTTIEQKVVEMKFDNKDFEKNVETSMSTLDKLKQALNFDNSLNSLKNLEAEMNGLGNSTSKGMTDAKNGMDSITAAADESSNSFSVLETVAIGALLKIGSSAADVGMKLVKSLTIDQVSAGWQKYENELNAVQTIMAATGKSAEEVYEQLDRVLWYTDETSYKYEDMVHNISIFTSAGIQLEDAVTYMMGIGNAAGLAGSTIQGTSHAMTGFAKAIGDVMQAGDWQWIETGGMATEQLKKDFIEAGIALGTLTKKGVTKSGTKSDLQVTAANFKSTLGKKWLTGDVVKEVLAKYGDIANTVYQLYEAADGAKTTAEILDELGEAYEGVGLAGFKASQECKTFTDAIDSVADAASTQWKIVITSLLGGYEEAKGFFTRMNSELLGIFVDPMYDLSDLMMEWRSMGGQKHIFGTEVESDINSYDGAFWHLFNNITEGLYTIREAWQQILPSLSAEQLFDLTYHFLRWAESIEWSTDSLLDLENATKGVAKIVKVIGDAVKMVLDTLSPFAGMLSSMALTVLDVLGHIGKVLYATLKINDATKDAFKNLKDINQVIADFVSKYFANLGGYINDAFDKLLIATGQGKNAIEKLGIVIKDLLLAPLRVIGDIVKDYTNYDISGFIDMVSNGLTIAGGYLYTFGETIVTFFGAIPAAIAAMFGNKTMIEMFKTMGDSILNTFDRIKSGTSTLSEAIQNGTATVKDFFYAFGDSTLLAKIGNAFAYIQEGITAMIEDIPSENKIAQFFWTISDAIKNFAEAFRLSDIAKEINNVTFGILELTKAGADFAKRMLNQATLGDVIEILHMVVDVFITKKITDVVKGFTDVFGGFVDGIKGSLDKLQESIDAKKLKALAESLFLIAASIVAISVVATATPDGLDTAIQVIDKLAILVVGFAALGTGLMGVLDDKMFDQLKSSAAFTTMLTGIGTAMLAMTAVIAILGSIDPTQLQNGISALTDIAGILGVLFVVIGIVDGGMAKVGSNITPQMTQLTKGVTALGVGIVAIVGAIAVVGMLSNTENFYQGCIVAGAVVSILAIAVLPAIGMLDGLVAKISDKTVTPKMTQLSGGLVGLAIGIVAIVGAVAIIGNISEKEAFKQGIDDAILIIGLLAGLEVAVGIANALSGRFGNMNAVMSQIMAGVVAIVATITAMMIPIAILAEIGKEGGDIVTATVILDQLVLVYGRMIGVILTAAGAIEGMTRIFGKDFKANLLQNMLAFVGAAAGFAAALILVAEACAIFGGIEHPILTIVAFGAAVAVLVGALKLLTMDTSWVSGAVAGLGAITVAVLAFAAAALVISVAIDTVVTAIVKLTTLSVTDMVTSITTMITTIVQTLSGMVVQIGAIIVGLAMAIIDQLLVAAPAMALKLATLFHIINDVLIPEIINGFGQMFLEVLTLITKYADEIGNAVFDLVLTVLGILKDNMTPFVETAVGLIVAFIDGITNSVGDVIDALFRFVVAIIQGTADAIHNNHQALIDAVNDLIIALLETLLDGVLGGTDLLERAAETFMNSGLIKGIGEKIKAAKDKMKEVIDKVIEKAKSFVEDLKEVGKGWIGNIITGITEKAGELWDKVTSIAKSAINWFKDGLDENSPSKATREAGRFFDEGFIKGVKDESKNMKDTVKNIADGTLDAFSDFGDEMIPTGKELVKDLVLGIKEGTLRTPKQIFSDALGSAIEALKDELALDDGDFTITPVLDLSNIQNGAGNISKILGDLTGVDITGSMGNISNLSTSINPNAQADLTNESLAKMEEMMSQMPANGTTVTNNNTFNITSDDPEEVADQVSQILAEQAERKELSWA